MSTVLIDPSYLFVDLPLSPFPHEMVGSLRAGSPFAVVSLGLSAVPGTQCVLNNEADLISLCFALLYFADNAFLQIEDLWQL